MSIDSNRVVNLGAVEYISNNWSDFYDISRELIMAKGHRYIKGKFYNYHQNKITTHEWSNDRNDYIPISAKELKEKIKEELILSLSIPDEQNPDSEPNRMNRMIESSSRQYLIKTKYNDSELIEARTMIRECDEAIDGWREFANNWVPSATDTL